MEHVKTFFKTLLWTLIILIVILWGFWAYIKFFNKDLGQSVAQFISKQETQECPICNTSKECPEAKECPICETTENNTETNDTNWLQNIEKKLDTIINELKWENKENNKKVKNEDNKKKENNLEENNLEENIL